MAEETKKTKKPRVSKKAGAGTELTAETKQENVVLDGEQNQKTERTAKKVKQEAAKKTAPTSAEETKQEEAKKAPAKKTVKKSVEKSEKGILDDDWNKRIAAQIAKNSREAAENVQTDGAAVEVESKEEKLVTEPKKRTAKKQAEAREKVEADKKPQAEQTNEIKEPEPQKDTQSAQKTRKKKPAKAEEKSAKMLTENTEKQPATKRIKKAVSAENKSAENQEPERKKPEKQLDKSSEKPALTKAEKRDFVKKLVREILTEECKWSDLVDRVAQRYKDAYPIPENDNLNDVKGRVGSVLHLMQEEGEIIIDGNTVKGVTESKKKEKEPTVSAMKEEKEPSILLQKAEETAEEIVQKPSVAVQKVEAAAPAPLYDLSLLFDKKKPAKKASEKSVSELAQEKAEEQEKTQSAGKAEKVPADGEEKSGKLQVAEKKPAAVKAEKPAAPTRKQEEKPTLQAKKEVPTRRLTRLAKADPLKDAFLKKLRSLGGNYFEYYAVYLLEKYSRMNGRRLEGLKISGGEYDGGIDGELELTDRLGFRETIYIQAKNWEPTDEKWWIGETLLQQFIGAVAYRQAKEGKQHCRGIYVTTSAFTVGAKEILEKMSDQFVGYDGDDLYDTAKECEFGLINDGKGNWKVDEELLSGKKSFFFMV